MVELMSALISRRSRRPQFSGKRRSNSQAEACQFPSLAALVMRATPSTSLSATALSNATARSWYEPLRFRLPRFSHLWSVDSSTPAYVAAVSRKLPERIASQSFD